MIIWSVTMVFLAVVQFAFTATVLATTTLGNPMDNVVRKKLKMSSADVPKHKVQQSYSSDTNIGETWTASDDFYGSSWFGITTSSTGKNQSAITAPGGLYSSYDYGQSWAKSPTAPEFPQGNTYYQAIASSSDGRYLATAITGGPILVSRDYGATWMNCTGAPVSVTTDWYSIAISATGKYIGGVVMGGYVYISSDYGYTWVRGLFSTTSPNIYGDLEATWFDIAMSATGQYMVTVCGSDTGAIYYSSDYGSMWDPATLATAVRYLDQQWVGVTMSGDGRNVTVVNSLIHAGLFSSNDYGQSFNQVLTSPNVSSLCDITTSGDGTHLALLSYYGMSTVKHFFMSEDGGVTWNTTTAPVLTWSDVALTQHGTLVFATAYEDAIYSYAPNCGAGYILHGFDQAGDLVCTPCPAGTYTEELFAPTCTECSSGTYSTTVGGASEDTCQYCEYPWTTMGSGDTKCPVLWLNAPLALTLILIAVLAGLLVLIFLFGNDNQLVVVLILAFPAMDAMTDLIYIMISRFYNLPMFIFCVLFFMHPAPMFLYKLYKYRALPYSLRFIWWLGYSSSYRRTTTTNALNPRAPAEESNTNIAHTGDHIPYPTILGRRFSLLISFEQHDSLYVVMLEMLTWVVAVVCQALTLFLLPAFLAFWLCVGIFLQMTKTISMGNVWNVWFYVWTGHNYWQDTPGAVDTEDLNYGLLAQFCLQTIPHIVIQSLNNTLLGTWVSDPIAIFSLVMAILMALGTIYKYMYHVGIRADPQGMKDIPLDRSVSVKIFFTNIEYKILHAKLVPHSRAIVIPTSAQLYYREQKNTKVAEELGTAGMPSAPPFHSTDEQAPSVSSDRGGLTSSLVNPMMNLVINPMSSTAEVIYAEAVFAPVGDGNAPPANKCAVPAMAPPPPPPPPRQMQAPYSQTGCGDRQNAHLAPHALPALPALVPVAAVATPYNPPSPTPSVLSASAACPPELICPLTQRIMTDPVICADGYTYDRAAIEQHFRSQQELLAQVGITEARVTSPTTKEQLESAALIPNRSLSALLVKFYASQE